MQSDLERELSFHVRERAEELQAGGMSGDEAAREARQAVRGLGKTPAFSVTVVATLAIAIGANSAVFSAIDAVLLRPSPFPNSDRLVTLAQVNRKSQEAYVAP